MKEKIAVYAGTFDPVTNGHLDVIERGSRLFDKLYVTIFINPKKKTLFSVEERVEMLKEATKHLDNVIVDFSDTLAVTYAKSVNANALLRGLRATVDFEYELQLASSNDYLDDSIEMIFLMSKPKHSFISSSTVKEIVSHNHSVKGLVPHFVEEALHEKINADEL